MMEMSHTLPTISPVLQDRLQRFLALSSRLETLERFVPTGPQIRVFWLL